MNITVYQYLIGFNTSYYTVSIIHRFIENFNLAAQKIVNLEILKKLGIFLFILGAKHELNLIW